MSAAENQDNTITSEKGAHFVGECWAGGTVTGISSIAGQPAMEAVVVSTSSTENINTSDGSVKLEVIDLTHSLKTRSAGNVTLKLKAAFLAVETGQTVSIGVNNTPDSDLTDIDADLNREQD
jgi:hypothetical protein